jgi:sugar phosphate isomerase/epimerase
MKALGIEVIELCNPTYNEYKNLADGKQTRKILDDNGMKCISAHFQMNALRNDHAKQIEWAQQIGMTQMSTADLGGRVVNGVTSIDEVKRAADEYNKIGRRRQKSWPSAGTAQRRLLQLKAGGWTPDVSGPPRASGS